MGILIKRIFNTILWFTVGGKSLGSMYTSLKGCPQLLHEVSLAGPYVCACPIVRANMVLEQICANVCTWTHIQYACRHLFLSSYFFLNFLLFWYWKFNPWMLSHWTVSPALLYFEIVSQSCWGWPGTWDPPASMPGFSSSSVYCSGELPVTCVCS